jgi:NADP-dependent 3-hydroxy acid dehydrogenase YdfG
MNKTAVVTGAGSGVGRAVALALAKEEWRVALLGRREATLRETAKLGGAAAGHFSIFALDVGEAAAVEAAGRQILKEFGSVQVLVNAAGTNTPDRLSCSH